MAENLDMPQIGNFSIQDTMDMGMGNQELLNDLMSPESATSNPDDIQDIKDEPAPAPTKKTTSKQPAASEPEPEKKDDDPKKDIQSFFLCMTQSFSAAVISDSETIRPNS